MATAEAAAGPRYAPDDPTLPKPWKGLIDGSTGLLYYWNPETNVTQYERPTTLSSPLANSQQHSASVPNVAQIPMAQNTLAVQPVEQIMQVVQQQGQQIGHLHPHLEKITTHQGLQVAQDTSNPHGAQEHVAHSGPVMQQPSQSGTHTMHYVGHQMSQLVPQIPQHGNEQFSQQAGQPMQQQVQQTLHSAGHQLLPHQNLQMPPLQGQPFAYQQTQYMVHPQSMHPQGQYNLQQQTQHGLQGQQLPYQRENQAAVADGDKVGIALKNQTGFSPSQFQQSVPNQPAGAFFSELQQLNGPTINMQRPASMVQLQQTAPDFVHHQHGSGFQNHMVPSIVHNQQSDQPPPGLKIGYDNSTHGRASDGYFKNPKMEGPMLGPSQPKLVPVHVARKHQELRMDGSQYKNFSPGYAGQFNSTGHSMHVNAIGGSPFPNNAFVRPPFASPSDVSGLSAAELYCQQNEVTATGDNVPAPFTTFEATNFPPEILRDIHSAGFSSPTPIQAQTWPIALQSRDIVAIAKTGSGKTLGYLIPAFILIKQRQNNPQNGPTVLVLAPTRELATQIQEEVIKFGRSSRISCTCLYGGVPKAHQLKELDRGADIVVATPGRLNDILETRKIHFGQISLLVLDEADRMLDMGFEPQIRKIVNEIPPQRQTVMYTATWPKGVRKIASDLLVNPVQVNIGSVDELEANKSIKQNVEVVRPMEKERRLEQILRSQERGSKVIIFCSTKRLCDQLARSISRNFGAVAIHGDKSQGERDWVLNQFRSGKSPILVATDVAARGLDIKDIRVVINYDFPTGIEDYVHRIGRTGRAGATGVSYTFFSEQDWKYAADLVKVLEGANQYVPPEVQEIALRGASIGKDRGGITRFDSGSGDRWGFGDRSRGEMRSGGFIGRGGMRDGGFGGRGGARDVAFGGRGGRNDSGRVNRGRSFGGPGGWARNDRGPMDRYDYTDSRGRGRGRGRGRFDVRRDAVDRSRDRSYSRSPERVRTWRYSRSRSRSRSWSRSRSRSWSGGRSRSRSYSHSPRRSRSRSPHQSRSSRSRSHSHGRCEREGERNFDDKEAAAQDFKASESGTSLTSGMVHVEKQHASSVSPLNQEAAEDSGYQLVGGNEG